MTLSACTFQGPLPLAPSTGEDLCEAEILDQYYPSPSGRLEVVLEEAEARVAPHRTRTDIDYQLVGIDSEGDQVVTAGACPNGFMYVSMQAALRLGDQDQRAWLVGHEQSHLDLGHHQERDRLISQGASPERILELMREHELEADCRASRITQTPPTVGISVLQALENHEGPSEESYHPETAVRIESLWTCQSSPPNHPSGAGVTKTADEVLLGSP